MTLMTVKVKEYKIGLASITEAEATPAATPQQLHESNVCLYRYGGFALHSLLKKYDPTSGADQHVMIKLLRLLKLKTLLNCLMLYITSIEVVLIL